MTRTWDEARRGELVRETPTGLTRRADWAALPLRAALGIGFMVHGYPKLFDPEGHEGFVGTLGQIGIPAPELMAWVAGIVEFVGGLGLLLGLFVVPIAVLGIIEMLVATFALHLPMGDSVELTLLYIAGFVALLVTGGGPWSIDAAIRAPDKPTDANPVDGQRHVGVRAPDEAPPA